jgi:hypothetical protein
MQDKMAEKRAPPNTSNMPNENDIQFLSNGYDDLVKSKVDTQNDVLNLKKRLDLLSVGVNRIDKAIDLLTYSYQYNLKIVGVPQLDDKESSDETAVLCIHFFVRWELISRFPISILHTELLYAVLQMAAKVKLIQ